MPLPRFHAPNPGIAPSASEDIAGPFYASKIPVRETLRRLETPIRPHGTSLGSLAIERFLRPVCYQNCPDARKNAHPPGLARLVDGITTRESPA